MEFSFKEKSLIVSIGVSLVIYGRYLFDALSNLSAQSGPPGMSEIVILIIWVVVLESIIQGVLASRSGAQLEDERDRLIEKVSYRYGYWFLLACIWFLIVQLILDDRLGHLPVLTPYALFHLLLLFLVVAELINFSVQLYYYRRGV